MVTGQSGDGAGADYCGGSGNQTSWKWARGTQRKPNPGSAKVSALHRRG